MLDIMILPHFFHLKNMLPDNLNKICVRILTLLLAFSISLLLTSSNFILGGISSDFIWEERKLKKLNPNRIFVIIVWSVFLSSLYFKQSFANNPFLECLDYLKSFTFFSMSSLVVEWWCAYSTLPLDGSRHDRIISVAGLFRVYLWIVTRYICIHKIYFFNFVFIVFLTVIFFPKTWQNLPISLVWNPSAIAYNTN